MSADELHEHAAIANQGEQNAQAGELIHVPCTGCRGSKLSPRAPSRNGRRRGRRQYRPPPQAQPPTPATHGPATLELRRAPSGMMSSKVSGRPSSNGARRTGRGARSSCGTQQFVAVLEWGSRLTSRHGDAPDGHAGAADDRAGGAEGGARGAAGAFADGAGTAAGGPDAVE